METVWKALSVIAVALTVVPAFLVFAGDLAWNTHATLMLVGTVLWFVTAPMWMEGSKAKRKRSA